MLYFIFIGWWMGLSWALIVWFFNLTIVGLSMGLAMINYTPQVTTLMPPGMGTIV